MLDSQTITVIKSTIPVLIATGPKLTGHFYDRMFSHNPELKEIFNISNQRNGAQRQALFDAICAYAANIENLSTLIPAIERIAQKHTSFNIQPNQYQIVGHHLLKTLEEMLNPGQGVIDAWSKAYGVLANVFIQREEQIYQQSENNQGGWRGTRAFKIIKKEKQSDIITSFVLIPIDGKPIGHFKPGQYLAIYIKDSSLPNQEIRQYSITNKANEDFYRIAVKREAQGLVSNYLHNVAQEGDTLHVAAPHGDFFLDISSTTPVAFISAGVGQTPLLSMLKTLQAQKHKAPILWLHATKNSRIHAFSNEVNEISQTMSDMTKQIWLSHVSHTDTQGIDFDHQGHITLDVLGDIIKQPDMHYYFCGPTAFMQNIVQQLLSMDIPLKNIHYECFGPHRII